MPTLEAIVSTHIHERWGARHCPVCEANSWTMNGPFSLVPAVVNVAGYVIGYRGNDASSPVVTMVCRDCGYTMMIDYNVMLGKEP